MKKGTSKTISALGIQIKEIQAWCSKLNIEDIAICCKTTPCTLQALLTRVDKVVDHQTQYAIQQFHAYCLLFHNEWDGLPASTILAKWRTFRKNKRLCKGELERVKPKSDKQR